MILFLLVHFLSTLIGFSQTSLSLFHVYIFGVSVASLLIFELNMAGSITTSVSWDNQLLREKARQKRKHEGGRQTELGDRLGEHEYPKKVLGEAKDPAALFPEYEAMVKRLLNGEDPSPPLENKHCPFHHVLLEQKVSANHWAYYRCPIRACPIFCGADRVDDWLTCLRSQLNPSYKEQPDQDLNISLPFVCFCKHELYQGLKYLSLINMNERLAGSTCSSLFTALFRLRLLIICSTIVLSSFNLWMCLTKLEDAVHEIGIIFHLLQNVVATIEPCIVEETN